MTVHSRAAATGRHDLLGTPVATHSGDGAHFAVVVYGCAPFGLARLIGHFDTRAEAVLHRALSTLHLDGFRVLTLDPSGLVPLTPAGALALHHVRNQFDARSGHLVTFHPAPTVDRSSPASGPAAGTPVPEPARCSLERLGHQVARLRTSQSTARRLCAAAVLACAVASAAAATSSGHRRPHA